MQCNKQAYINHTPMGADRYTHTIIHGLETGCYSRLTIMSYVMRGKTHIQLMHNSNYGAEFNSVYFSFIMNIKGFHGDINSNIHLSLKLSSAFCPHAAHLHIFSRSLVSSCRFLFTSLWVS